MKISEQELAQHFINHFEGFEIFKEVPASGIIDFVARLGNITTAVEVKTTFSFDVIEQAYSNLQRANLSYVAIPCTKTKSFAYQICKQYGIGVLVLDKFNRVNEAVKPKFNRVKYKLKLQDWQKENTAGVKSGRITPFSNTVTCIHQYLVRNRGKALMKDVLRNVETHYSTNSSANKCIQDMIKAGVIKDFYFDKGYLLISHV